MNMIPHSRTTNNPWDKTDDPLWLLSPIELESLPDGIILESINGTLARKGIDPIDQDTRFGMITWGFRESTINA